MTGPIRMPAEMLHRVQQRFAEQMRRWKAGNNRTTCYTCWNCKQRIPTLTPTELQAGDKGLFSSKTCVGCGVFNNVTVWADGRTKVGLHDDGPVVFPLELFR